jgi:LuxR family maltose regulon positive regulatory protein
LHRLRLAGDLCELRDRDLYFSLAESHDLLTNFGVEIAAADLALLHQHSEGWAAALQMAALSLRSSQDPTRVARSLDVRSHEISEYFISEVLEQQSPEVAQFMLDTSVLDELTADTCTALTGRQDAAELMRRIDAAHLFLVALDDERTRFRYHHLARQILRAELRIRGRAEEQSLNLKAAGWFESTGDSRRAARHFLAARQAERALTLLQDRVVTDFLRDPSLPPPPDLSMIDSTLLADAPDRVLALATDLLLSGDAARGGEYLDLVDRARPSVVPGSTLAARCAAVCTPLTPVPVRPSTATATACPRQTATPLAASTPASSAAPAVAAASASQPGGTPAWGWAAIVAAFAVLAAGAVLFFRRRYARS